jgi:hypothetical protein
MKRFMKLVSVPLFLVLMVIFVFLSGCDGSQVPTPKDLKLQESNGTLYAGAGEICNIQYSTVKCEKGLRCVAMNGTSRSVCLPEDLRIVNKSVEDRRLDRIIEDR